MSFGVRAKALALVTYPGARLSRSAAILGLSSSRDADPLGSLVTGTMQQPSSMAISVSACVPMWPSNASTECAWRSIEPRHCFNTGSSDGSLANFRSAAYGLG